MVLKIAIGHYYVFTKALLRLFLFTGLSAHNEAISSKLNPLVSGIIFHEKNTQTAHIKAKRIYTPAGSLYCRVNQLVSTGKNWAVIKDDR